MADKPQYTENRKQAKTPYPSVFFYDPNGESPYLDEKNIPYSWKEVQDLIEDMMAARGYNFTKGKRTEVAQLLPRLIFELDGEIKRLKSRKKGGEKNGSG